MDSRDNSLKKGKDNRMMKNQLGARDGRELNSVTAKH
jgi:hypothetical protein